MTPQEIQQVHALLGAHSKFIITTHIFPDGDGLGSEIALKHFLEKQGKQVVIINPDPTSERYLFIDPKREITQLEEARKNFPLEQFEVLIILDTSTRNRMGRVAELLNVKHLKVISLDHHETEGDVPGLLINNKGASAIGEMVYDVIKESGMEMDNSITLPLYISIVSDTGSFSFANTTSRCLKIAGDLLEKGVDAAAIRGAIFESNSLNQIMLLGECLNHVTTEYDGRILLMQVTLDQLAHYGLTHRDVYFYVDILRTIGRAELIAFFKEIGKDRVEISFRSRNNELDVAATAEKIGGGRSPSG